MLNYIQAEDEIKAHFFAKWKDGIANGLPNETPAIAPLALKERGSVEVYTPVVEWQNVERRDINDNGKHWARFTSQNVLTNQATLAGGRAGAIGTRYRTQGIIVVQLFFSKKSYKDAEAKALSLITQLAFVRANTPGGVWFRNSTIVELAPEEHYFRSNVSAEYEYDSIIK